MVKNEIKNNLMNFENISFDLFDTLVTRETRCPSDIFLLVREKLKARGVNCPTFIEDRINAEKSIDANCSLDDIYFALREKFNYSLKICDLLQEEEINCEIEYSVPREDIKELFFELKQQKKNVFIVSDMYLPEKVLRRILEKSGFPSDIEIFLSSRYKASKANGLLWKIVRRKYGDKNWIHIGDDFLGDYRQAIANGASSFSCLIKSCRELFHLHPCYLKLSKFYEREDVSSVLQLGKFIATVFNSPFDSRPAGMSSVGLWLAYPFLSFFDLLAGYERENHLLFVTREGYLLQPWFQKFMHFSGREAPKTVLFPSSRRASTLASLFSLQDVEEIFSDNLSGDLETLFLTKLGLDDLLDDKDKSVFVSLPEQNDVFNSYLVKYKDKILEEAKRQRELLLGFFEQNGLNMEKCIFVDVGYSGWTQVCLSKALSFSLKGCYIFLDSKRFLRKIHASCRSVASLTGGRHPIYDNLLFFESSIQVREGSVLRLERGKDGVVAGKTSNNGICTSLIMEGQREAEKYINYFAKNKKNFKNQLNFDFELSEILWEAMLLYDFIPISYQDELRLEDDFNGLSILSYERKLNLWRSETKEIQGKILAERRNTMLGKYLLKTYVKRYIPTPFYSFARKVWINLIK